MTRAEGVTSRHGFSFGAHYDPEAISFGALVAHNDETLASGHGYDRHRHRSTEIVTWVVDGTLRHVDSTGGDAVLRPGTLQVLSSGTGVEHSERHAEPAGSAAGACRFIQMWLTPGGEDGAPDCRRRIFTPEALSAGLVVVASGSAPYQAAGAVPVNQPSASLHIARLRQGQGVELPQANRVHVFVAVGTVDVASFGELDAGDSLLVEGAGARSAVAGTDAELLVWELGG